jgi:hypothetical protein
MATIPSADGTFTACVLRAIGTLRLIDPASQRCSSLEQQVAWRDGTALAALVAQLQADLAAARADAAATRSDLEVTRADLAAIRTALANLDAGVSARLGQLQAAIASVEEQAQTRALGGVLLLEPAPGGGRAVVRVLGADVQLDDGGAVRSDGAMRFLAGSDLLVTAGGNLSTTVGAGLDTAVGANASLSVGGSAVDTIAQNRTVQVGGSRVEQVALDQTLSVGVNLSTTVGASSTTSVGANIDVMGGNRVQILAGGVLKLQGATLQLQ